MAWPSGWASQQWRCRGLRSPVECWGVELAGGDLGWPRSRVARSAVRRASRSCVVRRDPMGPTVGAATDGCQTRWRSGMTLVPAQCQRV